MKNVSISSPWVTYWQEIKAMFGDDPEIKMSYDEDTNKITMRVDNQIKAEALERLLPSEVKFGNVTLYTIIVPSNTLGISKADYIALALKGNPHFSQVINVEGAYASNPMHFVMFNKEVAQYWGDNLGDPHGNVTTLYQELAKKLFGEGEGVFYCTEPAEVEELPY